MAAAVDMLTAKQSISLQQAAGHLATAQAHQVQKYTSETHKVWHVQLVSVDQLQLGGGPQWSLFRVSTTLALQTLFRRTRLYVASDSE